jgi:hypothetical protein
LEKGTGPSFIFVMFGILASLVGLGGCLIPVIRQAESACRITIGLCSIQVELWSRLIRVSPILKKQESGGNCSMNAYNINYEHDNHFL